MKLAIVFPDYNLAYSPTTIGLFNELSKDFNVRVFAIKPNSSHIKLLKNSNIIYVEKLNFVEKIITTLRYYYLVLFKKMLAFGRYRFKRQYNIFSKINNEFENIDLIFTIDADTYFYYNKFSNKKCIFLSLEIVEKDILIQYLKNHPPFLTIIQSQARYNYYFDSNQSPYLILPNSTNFESIEFEINNRSDFIYNGTVLPEFGIYACLRYFSSIKTENKLIIKGFVSQEMKKNIGTYLYKNNITNVIFNEDYVESNKLISFISNYKIGFCFYDRSYSKINIFNYETAPSGKLYAYLNAGVPVICSNQQGLEFIQENKCGICIADLSSESIQNAVEEIENNYTEYTRNCLLLAKKMSFNNYTGQIISFIKSNDVIHSNN